MNDNFVMVWLAQLAVMIRRNTTIQIRFWRSTLVQTIGAPIIFMVLLYVLQQADYANQSITVRYPQSAPLPGLFGCTGPVPCINILFTPDTPNNRLYLSSFSKRNAQRTGQPAFKIENNVNTLPTSNLGIVPIASKELLYEHVLQNQNVTNWGLVLNQTVDANNNRNIQYQVWYNVSRIAVGIDVFGSQLQSFMRGLDEAILSVLNDPSATISATMDVNIKDWPTVPPIILSDTVVQQLGPVFFFCCNMVIFINALSAILTEKEQKLRHGMEVMGLKPSVYWVSEFLSNTVLVSIGSLMTTCLGLALGFTSFRKTDFMVLYLTFFLFGESMVAFAFFLSTFFKKAQAGVFVGIFVFIVGLLFESFVFSSGYIGYVWFKPSTPIVLTNLLTLLPFFNFGKLFLDISTLTTGQLDEITNTYVPGSGFAFAQMYSAIPLVLLPSYPDSQVPNVPAPIVSLYYFLFDIILYATLTWYFDCVIPNEFGTKLKPWFFLTANYWGIDIIQTERVDQKWLNEIKSNAPQEKANIDLDVDEERKLALSPSFWPAVKVAHLRKEYLTWRGKVAKIAVHDTCITFEEGKLVALLGQNGAGKSTTINILSGLSPATYGDSLIYGFSLKTQMHEIRKIMGVCPQHDILFNELTGREHIQLYAGLKGVPKTEWEQIIAERLEAVKLLNVVDNPISTYSGGMKRRLSVVIATIGDPKIVFLDEPSTGMDPGTLSFLNLVNRRHVWSFIEKFKKGRVIILTTHSMEEADVLGDRIAIMAHGRIRALGDSVALKTKFGAGYKISIISAPHKLTRTKEMVMKAIPSAVLEDDSAGALLYEFPNSALQFVSGLVQKLNLDPYVKCWGLSQTTLEQVFLSVIRQVDTEKITAIGDSKTSINTLR